MKNYEAPEIVAIKIGNIELFTSGEGDTPDYPVGENW
jgi:hypothetical protein